MRGAAALSRPDTVAIIGRAGGRFKHARVDIYRRELERIRKVRGELTAPIIVQEATNPKSPIHECFEWDDPKAAHAYRIKQANDLCRFILVEVPAGKQNEGAFALYYAVPSKNSPQHRYVTLDEAAGDEEMESYVVAQALARLRAWRAEYSRVQKLKEIARAIEPFL